MYFSLLKKHIEFTFQPIVNTRKGEAEFFELLCRLYVDGKRMDTEEFINFVKENGHDKDLAFLCIDSAFETIRNFERAVSINVFSDNLDEELFEYLRFKFSNMPIDPQMLVFEIVERDTKLNNAFLEGLRRLKSLGCKIALDDFGTGTSNLDALFFHSFDYVKLDGNLIKNFYSEKHPKRIFHSIVSIIRASGAQPIAEHIEDDRMMKFAKENGIELMQGWAFDDKFGIYRALDEEGVSLVMRTL